VGSDDAGEDIALSPTGGALSHLDAAGRARMVDVTGKPWTHRRALARCRVDFDGQAVASLGKSDGPTPAFASSPWGEILVAAQVAGIQAAKRTAELVPLCHPLTLSNIEVRFSIFDGGVEVEGEAEVVGPTGVEMEALTACAFAALTIVSTFQRSDLLASIGVLELLEKSGGRSGTWTRR